MAGHQRNIADWQHALENKESGVAKSYYVSSNAVIDYCTQVFSTQSHIPFQLTVKADPLQKALQEKTLTDSELSMMLGAPEVLQFGQNFIQLIGAKKVLDIGTFTGASAVAWSLMLPVDGRVLSMDLTHKHLSLTRSLIEARPEVAKKIEFHVGPALEKLGEHFFERKRLLDALIAAGEAGTWDLAFIDADKGNYSNYYNRCVTLLRKGGVILIDNVRREA